MVHNNSLLAPASIEYKGFKFLITDQPTNRTMRYYIHGLKKYNVPVVVRVCEPAYRTQDLKDEGINVIDLVYNDGSFPPQDVVDGWLTLLRQFCLENPDAHVAVHCVAGLGRAPVLVALALMELGLTFEDTIELIREKKRGAINAKQLDYLAKYRPNSRLKTKNDYSPCCIS